MKSCHAGMHPKITVTKTAVTIATIRTGTVNRQMVLANPRPVIYVGAPRVKDEFESKSAPSGADKSLPRYTDPEPDGG